MKNRLLAAFFGTILSLGLAFSVQAQDKARKDLVLKGDAQCTRCHDAGDDYPVLAIGKTRHGTTADGRTPTCTSCHGASETHVNRSGISSSAIASLA